MTYSIILVSGALVSLQIICTFCLLLWTLYSENKKQWSYACLLLTVFILCCHDNSIRNIMEFKINLILQHLKLNKGKGNMAIFIYFLLEISNYEKSDYVWITFSINYHLKNLFITFRNLNLNAESPFSSTLGRNYMLISLRPKRERKGWVNTVEVHWKNLYKK